VLLRRLVSNALDFCYPGACAVCDLPFEGGGFLCADCGGKLTALADAGACEHCAKPLPMPGVCPYCHGRGVRPFERIIRIGTFDDPLKHLIHQMKYQKRWALAEHLADRLLNTERAKGLLTHTDVLVPVPLHIIRHVQRGYNQSEVIARRIGKVCDKPVVRAVRRTRATATQTHLHSHDARVANVKGAFALRRAQGRKIFGKHVVVVDDVSTSGATLAAVGRALKEAAPASLCALVLAIADPKGRAFEAV
jgi:ComF family protein